MRWFYGRSGWQQGREKERRSSYSRPGVGLVQRERVGWHDKGSFASAGIFAPRFRGSRAAYFRAQRSMSTPQPRQQSTTPYLSTARVAPFLFSLGRESFPAFSSLLISFQKQSVSFQACALLNSGR